MFLILETKTKTVIQLCNIYKIIIDKNGKIRSTLVGNSGNDAQLVNELKAMVEKLK